MERPTPDERQGGAGTTPLASRPFGVMLIVAVFAALLAPLIYLLVLAAGGAELVNFGLRDSGAALGTHDALPWLLIALVASLAALGLTFWLGRRVTSLTSLRSELREAQAAAEAAREEVRESERRRARLERSHREDLAQREGLIRAWRSEREWNRELRSQISRIQGSRGLLGRHDDVRRAVLELTMDLVDAEKGVLMSNEPTSGEHREVICFSGFENDPQESALAQRFAREVIERDATVREDDQGRVEAEKRTPADDEVRNLLAIPFYLADEFSGVIICANREGGFAEIDDDVLLAVGDHAGAVLQNSRLHGDLRGAYLSTIRVLADAIELKDPELRGHSDAVSQYVLAVADRLELEPREREELIFASLLHDVGKLGISERILLKPAKLTPEERSVIELHPRIGYQLVNQVPALRPVAPAVLHHHERFDGEGYPGRLRGDTIPLAARIIAIADAFSAMTSDRPYSPARSPEKACAELERCAGTQFDPEVVRLFVEEVRRDPATAPEPPPSNPELDVHRVDGEFRLGAQSFAITDSLTLLYSHRHFHETARVHAQRAALQDRPFAVLVAQLNNLDEINRTRGFAAGDEALQALATVFQHMAGRCQGQAYRASGRRIALLAPALDEIGARHTVDALLLALRDDGLDGTAGVTVGASAWRNGDDGEDVIRRALEAAERTTVVPS